MVVHRTAEGDPYAVTFPVESTVQSHVEGEIIISHVTVPDGHPVTIVWSFDTVVSLLDSLALPELARWTRRP